MAIYLAEANGQGLPNNVFADLAFILGTDDNGGLGTADLQPHPGYQLMAFSPQDPPTGANPFSVSRINDLINTVDAPIIVLGVDSTYNVPEIHKPVTNVGGITFGPDPAQPGPIPSPIGGDILVIYDVSGCNGKGYVVKDNGGQEVSMPSYMTLFHELAHAYHRAVHDEPLNDTDAQALAVADENKARQEHGLPIRSTANDDGGCGTTHGSWIKCFIVSAASGSPRSPEVQRFQDIRDNLLRSTSFGREFFQNLHSEYYQFSPRVAADMNASPQLKALLSILAVEPLLDYLTLAELYVMGGWERESFADEVARTLSAFADRLKCTGLSDEDIASVSNQVAHSCDSLSVDADPKRGHKNGISNRQPHQTMSIDAALEYLVAEVKARVPRREYIGWALAEPVTIYWALLVLYTNTRDSQTLVRSYGDALERWLIRVPVPGSLANLDRVALAASLVDLSHTVFTIPRVRRQFASRIHTAWSDRLPYDLAAMLRGIEYLPDENEPGGSHYGE
jgi:hypothetical protein